MCDPKYFFIGILKNENWKCYPLLDILPGFKIGNRSDHKWLGEFARTGNMGTLGLFVRGHFPQCARCIEEEIVKRCPHCARPHDPKKCPAKRWICYVCSKTGHTSRVCPNVYKWVLVNFKEHDVNMNLFNICLSVYIIEHVCPLELISKFSLLIQKYV